MMGCCFSLSVVYDYGTRHNCEAWVLQQQIYWECVWECVWDCSHRNWVSTCFWDWVSATSNFHNARAKIIGEFAPNFWKKDGDTLVGHLQVCSDSVLPIRSLPPPRTIQRDWYDGKFFGVFRGCLAKALLRRWHCARGSPCAEPHGCAGSTHGGWQPMANVGNRKPCRSTSYRELEGASHSIPPKPHQTTFHT